MKKPKPAASPARKSGLPSRETIMRHSREGLKKKGTAPKKRKTKKGV